MKIGDLVRVKYTGETVLVRGLNVPNGQGTHDDNSVLVSRARQTRDGIEYSQNYFHPTELETVESNIDREFNEAMYRRKLIEDAEEAAAPVTAASNSRVQ